MAFQIVNTSLILSYQKRRKTAWIVRRHCYSPSPPLFIIFKDLIENKDIWRMFWTKHRSTYRHVREYYSQMIFFTVCSAWFSSQNSNIRLSLLRDDGLIKLKFNISESCCLVLHIKHANNNSLTKGYTSVLEKYRYLDNEKHAFLVMNFVRKPRCSIEGD